MGEKYVEFDPSMFLDTEEGIHEYLVDAIESGDARVISGALGDVARAKGMSQLARETGLSRESLYRALSDDGNPQLATVLKVLDALGYELKVKPRQPDAA